MRKSVLVAAALIVLCGTSVNAGCLGSRLFARLYANQGCAPAQAAAPCASEQSVTPCAQAPAVMACGQAQMTVQYRVRTVWRLRIFSGCH